jgi:hypothetical protein
MCQAMQSVKHPSYLSCLGTCVVGIDKSVLLTNFGSRIYNGILYYQF